MLGTLMRSWFHLTEVVTVIMLTSGLWFVYDLCYDAEDAVIRARATGMLLIITKTVPFVLSLRCNACIFVALVLCVLDVVMIQTEKARYGDDHSTTRSVWGMFWAAVYLAIALFQLSRETLLYMTKQDLLAENQALEGLLSMLCDCQIRLHGDGNTVLRSDRLFDSIVGESMEGKQLKDVLEFSADETERTQSAFERACVAPVILPITIVCKSGEHVCADLLIVKRCRQGASAGTKDSSSFFFLVGIRNSGSVLGEGIGTRNSETDSAKNLIQIDLFEPVPAEDWAGSLTSVSDEVGSIGNSTTATGHCFAKLSSALRTGDRDIAKSCLQKVSLIGKAEKWIVPLSNVKLLPRSILGRGGFGIVICGRIFGTDVAVKLIRTKDSKLEGQLPSLLNEIRILRGVHHCNIVQFYGACLDINNIDIGLVFERVLGVDLRNFVRGAPQSLQDMTVRRCVLLDIVCGLRFLHAQTPSIIHGDLKSSNVMIEGVGGDRPRAKILDFGLSRLATRHANPAGGTPRWTAPEVIRDPKIVLQPNIDVFSFGLLFLFLISGEMPLADVSREEIIYRARLGIQEELRWPDGIEHLAENSKLMVGRCVSIDPKLRPGMEEVHLTILGWNLQTKHDRKADEEELSWEEGLLQLRKEGDLRQNVRRCSISL
eukprot:TRINITY_DN4703_c0_g1_i6.p1 TRINITY_DN4703_c0_g1~~TRINITY_DN4703_c0_g1_i6.p1  ORF type:complete len:668 (-),score=82.52 TRINITY_DN4703_c0_g1_i6:224-2194(-)